MKPVSYTHLDVYKRQIEAGARAGLVAVDDTTIEYLRGRPGVATGDEFEKVATQWRTYVSDIDAVFDAEINIDASTLSPFMTWGTNPSQVVAVNGTVPSPDDEETDSAREAAERALTYICLLYTSTAPARSLNMSPNRLSVTIIPYRWASSTR